MFRNEILLLLDFKASDTVENLLPVKIMIDAKCIALIVDMKEDNMLLGCVVAEGL